MILFISLAFPTLRQARSLDPCYFSEKLLYKNLRLVFLFRVFFPFLRRYAPQTPVRV